MLVDAVRLQGYNAVDINMGCPFPPQVHHGRGAALVENPAMVAEMSSLMRGEYADVDFSVKMRLGVSNPEGWRASEKELAQMPLSLLTVHPRVAKQQYSGPLYIEEFERIVASMPHPVAFNGDIHTPADAESLAARMPQVAALMVGRGLLGRPSLFAELRQGREWTEEEHLDALLRFHALLLQHYEAHVSGDGQVLNKIVPFWEYAEPLVGRKCVKALRKASSLNKYDAALAQISHN